jgi:Arylsulfotransferase (ASST)
VGTSLYVLDAQTVRLGDGLDYIVDGVTRIDDGLGTHLWDTTQIVDPLGLPGLSSSPYWLGTFGSAIDFAHANAIDVQEDGSWVMSLKHLDAIARVNADGSLRWVISGEPSKATFYGPSIPLLAVKGLETSFQHPHSVGLSPSGTVLVFDNGDVVAGEPFSRVIELAVDEASLQAEIVGAWELGVVCPVQSSVYALPDGSLLAACAATKELFELDEAGIRRRSMLSCRDGAPGNSFVRVQPLDG